MGASHMTLISLFGTEFVCVTAFEQSSDSRTWLSPYGWKDAAKEGKKKEKDKKICLLLIEPYKSVC